jgi:N-6 DNA Methylase
LGPFPVSAASITDFLRFLRALSRRPLEAASLAEQFGPQGETARVVVQALHDALGSPSSRTRTLHAEWLRLFGAIYGDQSNVSRPAVRALAATYDLQPSDDVGRMLFAVHTYFALLMKVLARELVALQAGAVIDPLVAGLPSLSDREFEREFHLLETGETFRALGIENFLEGDFLGWYTDEWSDRLRAAVRRLVRELGDYEPGTASLRPELTHDLLKELYHGLLPRDLRHALGEYYTPDWLAEYTLDRAEFIGRPGVRMLDPACGSGTFLVIAIRRLKEAARALGQSPAEIATAITSGIHGFDLNPLAVIAARTNYLLAAGDLVGAITPFRIPVFICDSITGVHVEDDSAPVKRLHTSVGDFLIPTRLAHPQILPGVMSDLEFCAENGFAGAGFERRLVATVPTLTEDDRATTRQLFDQICRLKVQGRDGIWPRLLTNAFAPLFARGQFDHVIGNPPWINWEEVSEEYRDATQPLWFRYGLYTLTGSEARLGGGKKDMSMLMTYVAAEEYLKPNGRLTFLITQSAFQTTGAGDGFRHFGNDRVSFSARVADDLANFNPFDDASNWTGIISLDRGRPTQYPVPYRLWNKLHGVRMNRRSSL